MSARICICDDDPVTGALLSLDLSAAGFEVEAPLTSVEAAIGYFSISAPDLLLLDLNMPGGGGLELLGYLRMQDMLPATRVVMLTSEDDVYFMDRARQLGAVGYLVKPVDSGHLASRVARALNDPDMRWIDDLSVVSATPARTVRRDDLDRAPAPQSRRRILSVEDVACNQQLVSLFLDDETCAVDQVSTGREALSALGAKRYDLLLLDLRLPDLDGLEVIRRIRRTGGGGRRLPIVAVSADVLPAQVAEALAAGADDHLGKPFSASALRAVVARRLGEPAKRLEDLNPIVAELTHSYGQTAVEHLLQALLSQLSTLKTTAPQPGPMEQAAHALKGAAASLGFTVVSSACSDLEAACRNGGAAESQFARAAAVCENAKLQIYETLQKAA